MQEMLAPRPGTAFVQKGVSCAHAGTKEHTAGAAPKAKQPKSKAKCINCFIHTFLKLDCVYGRWRFGSSLHPLNGKHKGCSGAEGHHSLPQTSPHTH